MAPPRDRRRIQTKTAAGRASRPSLPPKYSLQSLAQAAAGVPHVQFQAACYAYAGERSRYWELHSSLTQSALELAARRGWSAQVPDYHGIQGPYLAHLALLTLDHDACPELFRGADPVRRYAEYMRVTPQLWTDRLHERWEGVVHIWWSWLGQALEIMAPRLEEAGSEEWV